MSNYQPGHVRDMSDISDDTILGTPSPVNGQFDTMPGNIGQALGGKGQDGTTLQYVDLNGPTAHYSYPTRTNNYSTVTQYDNGIAVEHLSPNNPNKDASQHFIKASSGESQTASDGGETVSSRRKRFSASDTWAPEVLSLVMAVLAVMAMIVMLAHFDGRALPIWPSTFVTLNAVVAVLVTIAAAGVGIPLSNGLSQIKWIRVRAQGGAPLSDMDMFDNASRGAMGSFGLLMRGRGGVLGSFGATIVVITLLMSPFSQQIITYPNRTVAVSSSSPSDDAAATSSRALNYSLVLPGMSEQAAFVPILPLKAAVYNGLFAENGKPWLSLPFTCQTGNCTFEPFDTLAVCYSCVDMSEYMSRYCADGAPDDGDMSSCGWILPDGAKLGSSSEVFSMTSLFPSGLGDASYSTIMKLIFMGTESQSGLAGALNPWAKQCTLQACVQTVSSTVTNGQLNETVIHTTTNDTVPSSSSSSTSALEPVTITPLNGTGNGTSPSSSSPSSPPPPQTYRFSREAILGMQLWWSSLFANGTASRNAEFINRTVSSSLSDPDPSHVVVNLTVGISSGTTFFDTDVVQAFYWNYYEYPEGIEMLIHDLSVSTTVSMRSFIGAGAETINGTAFRRENFVSVRWGFAAVPIFAVAATGVFLALAAWRSRRVGAGLWKSSALAVMVHGLDGSVRKDIFGGLEGLKAQKAMARRVVVRLDEGAAGGGVLRVEEVY
ncbi:hypothetical protein GE09DRAFT_642249 [Coniochaeta sp. 2T2.1]|nr:hypothetical protein GE09DRAFT_642249 [Coniochaeta sp. 2T2.1]